MELSIRPCDKNRFPVGAVLIRGASADQWLHELQGMNLSLAAVTVYPLPGREPASVWGCLVVGVFGKHVDIGRNSFCQQVHGSLFIPEKSALFPLLSAEELKKIFGGRPHLLHPEIGLVELPEPIDWTAVLNPPPAVIVPVRSPAATSFLPVQVKSFRVKPVRAEEALEVFDEKNFPQNQKFGDKPLNPFEKIKLFLFRQLFSKSGSEGGLPSGAQTRGGRNPSWLEKLLPKKLAGWMHNFQQNLEELERRNQKHLDRLMDLLKKDPAEALKYALPLDNEGTGRGGSGGVFNLEKRWFDFSLFGGWNGGGSGAALLGGDSYQRLYSQYTATAQELIKQGEYRKAAFVYLKLLKNFYTAAETLEKGGLYGEAASVYLTYCKNKQKAAECFEKASMTEAAIELYTELGDDEKAGDLYLSLRKKKQAFYHYQKVADHYEANHQYLKASLLYKNKMEDGESARQILLRGWRLNRDAFNCLNNYFANIDSEKALGEEIRTVYATEVTPVNRETFLRVIQHEYRKHPGLSQPLRDMAYEIVSEEAAQNPSIVGELKAFNRDDRQLVKDTLRFKLNAG